MGPKRPAGERRRLTRRRQDANLRRILEVTADGIVVVDHAGTVCYANPAARALFGKTSAELANSVFGFPVVAGATTEVDVVRGAAAALVEMRTVELIWEGEPACLVTLRDVTDRRRVELEREERLRAEAALQARDAFLAMAAHELKTPLTRLQLAAQGALRRSTHGRANEALRRVDAEASHLVRLVRQLLDVARIEGGAVAVACQVLDLRIVVDRAVAAAAGAGRVVWRRPELPIVVAVDPALTQEAIADLIASALRYASPGATVEVSAARSADGAAVVVQDDGPPVPLEVREVLGGPYLPRQPTDHIPGRGIAFHAVRRVAELHGGELAVQFPEIGGTRVVLTLPTQTAEGTPPA